MDLATRLQANQTRFDLSVLILTLHDRDITPLYQELRRQSVKQSVQILWLGDNKSMKVGAKRNALLSLAEGFYVSFIDDDDKISPDYISELLAVDGQPDVITFNVKKLHNGIDHRIFKHQLGQGRPHLNPQNRNEILMNPGHLCAWKRSIITEAFNPDYSVGEDHDWAERMASNISSVHNIDKELYIYDYQTDGSETHRIR